MQAIGKGAKKIAGNIGNIAVEGTGIAKTGVELAHTGVKKGNELIKGIDTKGIGKGVGDSVVGALGVGNEAMKFTGNIFKGITNTASGLSNAAASTIQRNWRSRNERIKRNKAAQAKIYESDEYKKMMEDRERMKLMQNMNKKLEKYRKKQAFLKSTDMINHKYNDCISNDFRVINNMKKKYCMTTECSNDFNRRFQKWMDNGNYGKNKLCKYFKDCNVKGSGGWWWNKRDHCNDVENILDPMKGGNKMKKNKKKRTIRRKKNKKKRTIRRKKGGKK